MSLKYKVITEDEWASAAPQKPPSKRRNTGKIVCLREENGTRFYGKESKIKQK